MWPPLWMLFSLELHKFGEVSNSALKFSESSNWKINVCNWGNLLALNHLEIKCVNSENLWNVPRNFKKLIEMKWEATYTVSGAFSTGCIMVLVSYSVNTDVRPLDKTIRSLLNFSCGNLLGMQCKRQILFDIHISCKRNLPSEGIASFP